MLFSVPSALLLNIPPVFIYFYKHRRNSKSEGTTLEMENEDKWSAWAHLTGLEAELTWEPRTPECFPTVSSLIPLPDHQGRRTAWSHVVQNEISQMYYGLPMCLWLFGHDSICFYLFSRFYTYLSNCPIHLKCCRHYCCGLQICSCRENSRLAWVTKWDPDLKNLKKTTERQTDRQERLIKIKNTSVHQRMPLRERTIYKM